MKLMHRRTLDLWQRQQRRDRDGNGDGDRGRCRDRGRDKDEDGHEDIGRDGDGDNDRDRDRDVQVRKTYAQTNNSDQESLDVGTHHGAVDRGLHVYNPEYRGELAQSKLFPRQCLGFHDNVQK